MGVAGHLLLQALVEEPDVVHVLPVAVHLPGPADDHQEQVH